jgi:hypothetical protein
MYGSGIDPNKGVAVPSGNLIRWSGLAAMVGGALWVILFVLFALRSSGPGLTSPYRSFEGLSLPILLSLLLIVSGFVGVHIWRREVYGRFGTVGFVLAIVGAIVSVVSLGSWPLIFIGSYALMIGSLLVGAATLVTNALPRWGSIALIVGSVAFLLFNTETAVAWFALPYGVAWAAVGYLLWSGEHAATEQPSRVR